MDNIIDNITIQRDNMHDIITETMDILRHIQEIMTNMGMH